MTDDGPRVAKKHAHSNSLLTIEHVFGIVVSPSPRDQLRVRVHKERSSNEELICGIDASHARISSAQRELFRQIAEADRRELWRGSGARDLAHWLCMRQGISSWKAGRWIASCARAPPADLRGVRLR
jgi:hypothetical protein